MVRLNRVVACLLTVFALSNALVFAAGRKPDTNNLTKQAEIRNDISFGFQESWNEAPQRYSNAIELVRLPLNQVQTISASTAPRLMAITEQRLSHEGAVRRLKEIEAEYVEKGSFLEIGGWPALQRYYMVPMERRGTRAGDPPGTEMSMRFTTAVAYGNVLVRLEGVLQPGGLRSHIQEIAAIGQSLKFTEQGEPGQVAAVIAELQGTPRLRPEPVLPSPVDEVMGGGASTSGGGIAGGVQVGPVQVVQTAGAGSEIEVAVSTDAMHVVVASNGRNYATSNDGGLTFPTTGTAPPPTGGGANGDPSVAYGATGTFYFAYIGFPSATTCSTGFTTSTDNGQSFNFVANSTICDEVNGPTCFPDQEHIAADRWNLSSSNEDQVYSTWRDFSGGGCNNMIAIAGPEIPSIVCSSDSAQNWTPKAAVDASGRFIPRITVGSDGFVYVVYRSGNNIMLHKYSSCDSGLNAQAGFPVMVTTVSDVMCPVPGLDRCNNGNNLSSATVAVDDTNPSHVYVAYSTTTNAGVNENVQVIDSMDGGATWGTPVTINGGGNARRFMSWVCSTGGLAVVSWYDTRNAAGGQTDDTDYYCATVSNDGDGNLVPGTESRLSPVSDALCNSGWPCPPRAAGDSESCPNQPQLAGVCTDMMGNSTGARCDFSDCGGANMGVGAGCQCNIGNGETCNTGGGCPKYGDYNGNYCEAGNVYSSWASATTPADTPSATNVDAYYAMKTIANLPPVAQCMAFDDIADDSCCIEVSVDDINDGSFDPNGPADIDTICITAVDGMDVGCVQTTEVCDDGSLLPHAVTLTITDMSGESDSCDAEVEVIDQTPATINVNVLNMEPITVDSNCEVVIDWQVDIADNCCVDHKSFTFDVQVDGATQGMVTFDTPQVLVNSATRTGRFTVSDLTECPALVTVTATTDDCAGNGVQSADDTVQVYDVTAPAITCPEDIVVDRGDKLCNDEVQDWLDSVMATDNCSSLPTIQETTPFLALDIPDLGEVSDTINITDSETIEEVAIDLWITHDFVGDLQVELSHGGTSALLVDGPIAGGCQLDNFVGVVLSDAGSQGIDMTCDFSATSPPIYRPSTPLDQFDGLDSAGDWTITVRDTGNGGTGRFDVWGIRINGQLLVVNNAPPCGFPADSTTTVAFTALDVCNNSSSCTADITVLPPERVDATHKGSLLVFPNVDVKWDQSTGSTVLVQDTFLSVTNDYNEDVDVHFLFVNGDDELDAVLAGDPPMVVERAHPGWNKQNWTTTLTQNQTKYFSVMNGQPGGAPGFRGLDNGPEGPGRPDFEGNGLTRTLRGFVLAWAVDSDGRELTWNHLSGVATIVDYANVEAWEYLPYAYTTNCTDTGEQPMDCTLVDENGTCCTAEAIPGQLDLDGFQYAVSFSHLLLDFFGSGSTPFGANGITAMLDTDLSLLPMVQDLRQNNFGPISTKATFDIWNQNEDFRSGTHRCLYCWDQFLLSNTASLSNNFLVAQLGTDKGKARIIGEFSDVCEAGFCCERTDEACIENYEFANPGVHVPICSESAPLLGVAAKLIGYSGSASGVGASGTHLRGGGRDITGQILADLPSEPLPASGESRDRGESGSLGGNDR